MPISVETLADESRELRFTLQQHIDAGLSEKDALVKLFPKDSNRRRRLKTWQQKGLFPIPPSERAAYTTTVNTTGATAPQSPPTPTQTAPPPETTETTVTKPDIEPREASRLQTVVPRLFDTTDMEPDDERHKKMWQLIDQRVAQAVEAKLSSISAGFHVSEKPAGGPGRFYTGGRTHAKINVSVPAELNEALEQLGGVKSQHVANAIRLYLDVRKGSSGAT